MMQREIAELWEAIRAIERRPERLEWPHRERGRNSTQTQYAAVNYYETVTEGGNESLT